MLCVQDHVPLGEPVGGVPMQLATADAQQRQISAFLDESVGEEKAVAFGQDQGIANEALAGIVRRADQLAEQS